MSSGPEPHPVILGFEPPNSRLFFPLGSVDVRRITRRVRRLLELLETDEVAHFLARLVRERLELLDEIARLALRGRLGLAEEFAHLQVEHLEDLEERVEADLVFALLHAR